MKFLIGLLTIALIALKLIGEISLCWFIVFLPILGYIGFMIIIFLICLIICMMKVK